MSDLKRCPFCGKEPFHWTSSYYNADTDSTAIQIRGYSCRCSDRYEYRTPSNWNHRPIEDALRTELQAANERIERLRKALTHLINKAHAVTRIERHGMRVSLDRIRQLYDAQLKAEEIEKETT